MELVLSSERRLKILHDRIWWIVSSEILFLAGTLSDLVIARGEQDEWRNRKVLSLLRQDWFSGLLDFWWWTSMCKARMRECYSFLWSFPRLQEMKSSKIPMRSLVIFLVQVFRSSPAVAKWGRGLHQYPTQP